MKILAHRGLWKTAAERNSIEAIFEAFNSGFGVETDVRDYRGELVISHDIANETSPKLSKILNVSESKYRDLPLAINVKSDGLYELFSELSISSRHFFFDMSVPDMRGYLMNGLNTFSRYSDIEPSVSMYEECCGIWLDNFESNELNLEQLNLFLSQGKEVALVSPELHSMEHKGYWMSLRTYLDDNPMQASRVYLCTDFPVAARDFFNEQ